jgi:uncharacterized membrane protein required for colicin V production
MIWIAYDAIALLILIVSVLVLAGKGFISSLVGFGTFIVSLLVAFFVSGWLASPIYETLFRDRLYDSIAANTPNFFARVAGALLNAGAQSVDNSAVTLIRFVLFALLIMILYLSLRALAKLFQGVNEIPLIGGLNRVLGGILGLCLGVFICLIVGTLAAVLIGASKDALGWMNTDIMEDSVLFSVFYRYNFLNLL